MSDEGKLMKYGLIIAAAIIVIRIAIEQLGASPAVAMIFGVAWLYFIMPVLFALAIRTGGYARAYARLLKDVVLFAVYTRIMVAVTYMLAWHFKWDQSRFAFAGGGTVGPDVSPLQGLLIVPVRNALILILMATVIGMLIGSITLAIRKQKTQ